MIISTDKEYVKLNGVRLPGAVQSISINGVLITSSSKALGCLNITFIISLIMRKIMRNLSIVLNYI